MYNHYAYALQQFILKVKMYNYIQLNILDMNCVNINIKKKNKIRKARNKFLFSASVGLESLKVSWIRIKLNSCKTGSINTINLWKENNTGLQEWWKLI